MSEGTPTSDARIAELERDNAEHKSAEVLLCESVGAGEARIAELEAELQKLRTELGRLKKGKGALPWRTGRRVSRTIYDRDDAFIGVMDTAELAALAVEAVNRAEPALAPAAPAGYVQDFGTDRALYVPPPAEPAAVPGRRLKRAKLWSDAGPWRSAMVDMAANLERVRAMLTMSDGLVPQREDPFHCTVDAIRRVLDPSPDEETLIPEPYCTPAERAALDALHMWLHSERGDVELTEAAADFHEGIRAQECARVEARLAREQQP